MDYSCFFDQFQIDQKNSFDNLPKMVFVSKIVLKYCEITLFLAIKKMFCKFKAEGPEFFKKNTYFFQFEF